MGIFNLKGYNGEAEILGELREVEFGGRTLTIYGLTILEANEIIGHLATNQLAAKQPGGCHKVKGADVLLSDSGGPPAALEEPPEASTDESPKPASEPETPPVTTKAEESSETVKEEAAADKPPSKKRGRGRPAGSKNKPAEKETKGKDGNNGKGTTDWVSGEGEAGGLPGGVDTDMLAKLKEMDKVRDVIAVLAEKHENRDDIRRIVDGLKDDIPVLAKASNLDKRWDRLCESVGV
jgi:hypothetical protein